MQNFRTDLALERRDLYKKANNIELLQKINTPDDNIKKVQDIIKLEDKA